MLGLSVHQPFSVGEPAGIQTPLRAYLPPMGESRLNVFETIPDLPSASRPITQPLLFHSDRGIQYACNAFTKELSSHKKVNQSMSGKGDCWNNAVAESFLKTLKTEWVNRFINQNHNQLAFSLFDYIETFYNTQRANSALGYVSP